VYTLATLLSPKQQKCATGIKTSLFHLLFLQQGRVLALRQHRQQRHSILFAAGDY
jgi:hypothetical protein